MFQSQFLLVYAIEAAEHQAARRAEGDDRYRVVGDEVLVRVLMEAHRVVAGLVQVRQAVVERMTGMLPGPARAAIAAIRGGIGVAA
ncbi:hypothetical protein OG948_58960 (plasmid) [Embleya sp. NBC_00888]|nr:hypothetical protein OG948_58960 [Embleya sp. NBC_00888]